MNDFLFQGILALLCIPTCYLLLKLIFKESIMVLVGTWTVVQMMLIGYTYFLVGKLGLQLNYWVVPLDFIVGVLIFLYLKKIITSPLQKSIEEVRLISQGNLNLELQKSNSGSELGTLNNAILDLSVKLKEIIGIIKENAENLTTSSKQLQNSSQTLSQGANEQASSIEQVSATMEEILANVEQNTANAKQTDAVSNEANQGIQDVAKKSQQSIAANKEIAGKISIINDIAFQTNILALNAAVEAARAGEHGKGFAVVAAEVRKLAENSKRAADEIVKLTQSTLQLTEDAGEVMNTTIPKIENTTQLVREIAASSQEQNSGVSQVNNALQQLNGVTQSNAGSSEELAANAEELNRQASMLMEEISRFKIDNNQQNYKSTYYSQKPKPQERKNKPMSNVVKLDMTDSSDDEFTSF